MYDDFQLKKPFGLFAQHYFSALRVKKHGTGLPPSVYYQRLKKSSVSMKKLKESAVNEPPEGLIHVFSISCQFPKRGRAFVDEQNGNRAGMLFGVSFS